MTYNKYDFEARALREVKSNKKADDDKKRAHRKQARKLKFMLAEAEKKAL